MIIILSYYIPVRCFNKKHVCFQKWYKHVALSNNEDNSKKMYSILQVIHSNFHRKLALSDINWKWYGHSQRDIQPSITKFVFWLRKKIRVNAHKTEVSQIFFFVNKI